MAQKIRIITTGQPLTGDPIKGNMEEKSIYSPNKPLIDQKFDTRDRLAELVTLGNSVKADDKGGIYSDLVTKFGPEKAQKVMNHVYLFNQRPEIQKLPLEDKLRAFYTIGSNDPDVHGIIQTSKSLGYGPLQGFRNSSSDINQQLSGRVPAVAATGIALPEIQKRVMVKVRK